MQPGSDREAVRTKLIKCNMLYKIENEKDQFHVEKQNSLQKTNWVSTSSNDMKYA